jgi:hypothetical protein
LTILAPTTSRQPLLRARNPPDGLRSPHGYVLLKNISSKEPNVIDLLYEGEAVPHSQVLVDAAPLAASTTIERAISMSNHFTGLSLEPLLGDQRLDPCDACAGLEVGG